MRLTVSIAAALALLSSSPARAQLPKALEGVGIDQHLDGKIPLDLRFTDESGASVRLGDYFGSKPVVLALVYYECPMLCTLVLNGLVSSVKALSFDVGNEFEIVTLSFDPNETSAMAAAKKETYLEAYRRPGAAKGWHFLTGDEASIKKLADAVGFRYRYDPASDEFAHAAGITVLTPSGRIARYFYGVEFAPRDLRLGLIEAADETIGSPVDQLLLYCFRYDVTTGKYSAAVLNLVRLGGVLTVLAFVVFLIAVRLRSPRRPSGTRARPIEQV
jgi:protein SCO1/2